MNYTLSKIAKAVNGKLVNNDKTVDIQKIAIDSRLVRFAKHTLFFAIRTARNDGHNYLLDAYQKGVRNFVVEKEIKLADAHFIVVNNSVDALQRLAKYHREQFNIPVIGITGSNGKTIVKEWLNQLLATEYNIIRSPKSYNSQLGVPISVLNLDKSHQLAIFEAGISEVDEMEKLADIIQPTVGILTNIGQSHLENFDSVKVLVSEKMKLFKHAKTLILPRKYLKLIENNYSGKTITWGSCLACNLSVDFNKKSSLFEGTWNKREIALKIPFSDKASRDNSLTCCTTLLHLGYKEEIINNRLENLSALPMRLNIVEGNNGCSIINDSYSLDVYSLEIALDFMKKHETNKNKIVVLSDVVSGKTPNKSTYREIDKILVNHNVNQLIAIGSEIKKYGNEFSMPVSYYPTVEDFLADEKTIKSFKNTDILIKGARKFAFEKIVFFLQAKSHSTVLEINLNAITNNLNYFKSLLRPKVKIMVMVKALSYGSGVHEIAQLLAFNRIDYLGVAYTDEGVKLRKAGISLPIMVMNPDWNQLIENHLEPEIFSFKKLVEFTKRIKSYTKKLPYPIHLKIDTGMHRLGFEPSEIEQLIDFLKNEQRIKIASVFTHLAASDNEDEDNFTRHQLSVFATIASKLEEALGYTFIRHALNTAGIMRFADDQMDMVRLGIGLYGISSVEKYQKHLENVGTLKTYISQVKNIKKGESVGYNRAFIASEDCQIATIPIGYADGFSRAFSQGKGQVLCRGKLVPVVGNVCMDMTMINTTGLEVNAGDEVLIFGENLSVNTLAANSNTISYEVLSQISDRVKRVFVEE